MRNTALAAVVGLILASVVGAEGFNSDELNHLTLVNKTGHEIQYVFCSPGDSQEWGADVLGSSNTLADGGSRAFYIHYPDESDKFDFLVIDDQGNSYVIFDHIVQDGKESTITFTPDTEKTDEPKLNLANVKVTNKTGKEIYFVFVSPHDSQMWGLDVLDDQTTLADGDSYELLVPLSSKQTKYDFMGATEGGAVYQFTMSLSKTKDSYSFDIEPGDLQ